MYILFLLIYCLAACLVACYFSTWQPTCRTHTHFFHLPYLLTSKKSSHNGGKLPCRAFSVLLSITSHIWCTPQNTLQYKSGWTRKNCQSKTVFFCFFILPIIPSPFMSIWSPLFISLFLGPLFTEQWRQSGVPWGQRRASLNIKSPQWTPRQTPRSSIP